MARSKGFSIVEGVIVLGVLVLLAGVGYLGLKAMTKQTTNNSGTTTSFSSPKSAEVLTSKEDLESAEKELDNLSFDDESATEAEAQANL